MSSEFDIITLRGLTARGQHGVFPFEREGTQPFSVDVALWVDTRPAAAADDIDLTVSYADIAEEAVAVLTGPSVYLLETLASRVADVALAHPRVEGVEVTVHKPMAPLRQQFSDVSVTIRRGAAAGVSGPDITGALPVVGIVDEGDPVAARVGDPAEDGAGSGVSDTGAPGTGVPAAEDDTPAPAAAVGAEPSAAAPGAGVPAAGVPGVPDPDRTRPTRPRRIREDLGSRGTDRSSWHDVVLALGGNIGDAPTTLAHAVAGLVDLDDVQVSDVSPLVRTRAVLAPDQDPQPDYWNAVVLARSGLGPQGLLEATSGIETALGRVRHEHWGARTLDIDIIQYAGVTSADPHLTLPHPRAGERAFVLIPWELVDPGAVLQGVGPVAELARVAGDRDGVLDAVSDWLEDPGSVAAESDEVLAERDSASVIPTPAGGSVVVAAESHAQGRPSRLDLMPEASRAGLRPSDSGEDYLWHRLWEQWEGATQVQAPASAPSQPPSELAPQPSSELQRHSRPSAAPVAPPAGGVPREAGNDTQPDRAAASEADESAAAGHADPVARTATQSADPEPDASAGDAQAAGDGPGGAESVVSRPSPSSRRRAGMWVPLRGSAGRTPPDGGDAPARPGTAEGTPGTTHRPPTGSGGRRVPALPEWDFITGERVRIVDDASDLRPAPPAESVGEEPTSRGAADSGVTPADFRGEGEGLPPASAPSAESDHSTAPTSAAEPTSAAAHAANAGEQAREHGREQPPGQPRSRRSILRVDLPPGTPEGPLGEDERTQTSILRGITVRPTVTGQLPVQRRPHHEDGQA